MNSKKKTNKTKIIEMIDNRLERARSLQQSDLNSVEFKKWIHDTRLLFSLASEDNTYFLNSFLSIAFRSSAASRGIDDKRPIDHRPFFLAGLRNAEALLQSFRDLVDQFYEEESEDDQYTKNLEKADTVSAKKEIFVVHGHDEAVRLNVMRIIEKIGLIPIVLHEQPNQGDTIIEKFEKNSNVPFAICLWTADDVGKSMNAEQNLLPRARQNVIFETGYFAAKLGRRRVVVLKHESVEIPSDYQGVVYINLDNQGAWILQLGRELKTAGFDIDLNKLI